ICEEASLFGLAAIAVRTCRNSELMIGEKVLIIGAGILGLLAGQVASAMAGRVTICDIDKKKLELAESIGFADKVIDSSEGNLSDIAGISTYDIVMDFAGVEGMEDELIKCVKYKGKILFIAGRFRVNYNFNEAQIKEINIKQNSHFDRYDLLDAARLCKKNKISTKPLIWDVKPLSEAEKIYKILRDTPNQLLGTVFDWR
ncbi:MAG: zinc-binding dehydrogenase, partial [Armatimonadota bacterium]